MYNWPNYFRSAKITSIQRDCLFNWWSSESAVPGTCVKDKNETWWRPEQQMYSIEMIKHTKTQRTAVGGRKEGRLMIYFARIISSTVVLALSEKSANASTVVSGSCQIYKHRLLYTEWQRPSWWKIYPRLVRVGGSRHPLSLYLPSRTKLWSRLQLRTDTPPSFLLYPYMYSVFISMTVLVYQLIGDGREEAVIVVVVCPVSVYVWKWGYIGTLCKS
jgi:hypothetical protein